MKFRKNTAMLIVIICVSLLFPVALNIFFINGDIKTGEGMTSSDWLLFWGSFIGGFATLFAVFFTLRQNSDIIQQNDKIVVHNQKNLRLQEDMLRLNLMPFLDPRVIKDNELHKQDLYPPNTFIILKEGAKGEMTSPLPKQYQKVIENNFREISEGENGLKGLGFTEDNFVRLEVTQKTKNIAKNIKVAIFDIERNSANILVSPQFTLGDNEKIKIPLFITRDFPLEEFYLTFDYEDIEGRGYKQQCAIRLREGRKGIILSSISSPHLKDIDVSEDKKSQQNNVITGEENND